MHVLKKCSYGAFEMHLSCINKSFDFIPAGCLKQKSVSGEPQATVKVLAGMGVLQRPRPWSRLTGSITHPPGEERPAWPRAKCIPRSAERAGAPQAPGRQETGQVISSLLETPGPC